MSRLGGRACGGRGEQARRRGGACRAGPACGRAPAAALAALVAVAALGAAAGCGGPEVRKVGTTLGREVRITLHRDGGEVVELARDPAGAIELPLEPRRGDRLDERIVLAEPGKPELWLALEVLVDPDPSDEDALHFRSSANRQVVRAAKQGVAGRYEGAARTYAEPLELLRDPLGGPWFLPAEGRGLVVVIDPATFAELDRAALGDRVRVAVGGRARPLVPLPDRLGAEPLVFPVEGPTPKASLQVERAGYQTYERLIDVWRDGYTLVAVRLAPERRR